MLLVVVKEESWLEGWDCCCSGEWCFEADDKKKTDCSRGIQTVYIEKNGLVQMHLG